MTIDPKTKKAKVKMGDPAVEYFTEELYQVPVKSVPVYYEVKTKVGDKLVDSVVLPIPTVEIRK